MPLKNGTWQFKSTCKILTLASKCQSETFHGCVPHKEKKSELPIQIFFSNSFSKNTSTLQDSNVNNVLAWAASKVNWSLKQLEQQNLIEWVVKV